jgi:hypothetical protein
MSAGPSITDWISAIASCIAAGAASYSAAPLRLKKISWSTAKTLRLGHLGCCEERRLRPGSADSISPPLDDLHQDVDDFGIAFIVVEGTR